MSYTIKYSLDLGPARAGLTLAAQLVDNAGDDYGDEITTGLIEIGGGFYMADITVPDSFSGGIKFYESGIPATILKFTAISLYEQEAVGKIKAKTDNLPAQPAAVGAAMALTSDERNAVATALLDLADAIDGKTLRQALQIVAAVVAGKVSGAGSGTESFRGLDDGQDRVVVTADAYGNRTNVTYP
jgi:hypothetical protein